MKKSCMAILALILMLSLTLSSAFASCPGDEDKYPPQKNYSPLSFRCFVKTCKLQQKRFGKEKVHGCYYQMERGLERLCVNWEQSYVDSKNHFKTRQGTYYYPWRLQDNG